MNRVVITGLSLILSVTALSADSDQKNCASITSDTARLACYDKLNNKSATPSQTADSVTVETVEQGNPVSVDGDVAISAETLFGRRVGEQKVALEKSANVDHLEFIDAHVEQIDRNPLGKITIVLSNQQIWKQISSSRLHLKVGDSVHIERAALGSFLLEKSSGSSSMRVKRID